MDPDIISSWFPKFLEAHDLPSIHFHSLRHSNVSILIAAHVPITTVSGRLGHAQTSTTLNYYASALQLGTHLLHREGVIRAIGRLVLGGQDMSSLVERLGFTAKGPTHRHWSACRAYLRFEGKLQGNHCVTGVSSYTWSNCARRSADRWWLMRISVRSGLVSRLFSTRSAFF